MFYIGGKREKKEKATEQSSCYRHYRVAYRSTVNISFPVFFSLSLSHFSDSTSLARVCALVNASLIPTLSADNANLGQHRRLRRKKEVERRCGSAFRRSNLSVASERPFSMPENVHGNDRNLVTKTILRAVSRFLIAMCSFRNTRVHTYARARFFVPLRTSEITS